MSRDAHYIKMIQAQQWLQLRKRKIEHNPICECCAEKGLVTPATEVHHKIPVETALSLREMRQLMYDYNNLEALCHDCHVKRHKSLKSHSRIVQRERNDKKNARFMTRYIE